MKNFFHLMGHFFSETAITNYKKTIIALAFAFLAVIFGLMASILPAVMSAAFIAIPVIVAALWTWPTAITFSIPLLAFGLIPFAAIDFSRLTEVILISGCALIAPKIISQKIQGKGFISLEPLRYMKWPMVLFLIMWSIALIKGSIISKNHFSAADAKRYIGYLALIPLTFIGQKNPKIIAKIIVSSGTLAAAFLLLQLLTGWKVFAGTKGFMEGGAGAGFEDVARGSAMGGDYLVIFMLFYSLSIASIPGARHRIWFTLLIPIYLMGVIATYSRGLWAGMALAFLIFPLIEYKNIFRASRTLIFLVLICGTITVAVYPWMPRTFDAIASRIESIRGEGGRGTSVGARLDENMKGIESIKQNPLLGLGHGGEYKKFTPQAERGFVNEATFIHNSYLWMLVKFGAPGIIFVLAITAKIVSNAWQLKLSENHEIRPLRTGVICFMIAWLTNGMSSPVWAQATDLVALSLIIVLIGTLRNPIQILVRNHEIQHNNMHLEQHRFH